MLTVAGIWLLGYVLAMLRISVPYVMAALGGTVCERAGVTNIALEAFLLLAALGAALGAPYGAPAAVLCGLGAGLATAALYGLLVVFWRGDQIVCGVAMFMLADGLSRFLLKVVFGSTSNSPQDASSCTSSATPFASWPSELALGQPDGAGVAARRKPGRARRRPWAPG